LVLAEDFVSLLPSGIAEPDIKIYEYESGTTPARGNEAKPAGSNVRPTAGASEMDELFVRATPLWKRLFDVVGAITGLIALSPLFLIVACAIKLGSPGPVFFVQRRTGLGGKDFPMYKFRTMVRDAEEKQSHLIQLNEQDGPAFKIGNDPRITPIGHWLRRLSVDELPQLLNVLRGEMSLVGPRPLPCSEARGCQSWQRRRLTVTPGMTCSWQVQDRTTLVPFNEWMRMDVQYAESRCLLLDLKLLAKTLLFVIGLRGR
jgi:lipopolysaccharide/colanic/teichoic acid biosynthesis glycosyltransferase